MKKVYRGLLTLPANAAYSLFVFMVLIAVAMSLFGGCTITVKVIHETPAPQFRPMPPNWIDTSWYSPYRGCMLPDSVRLISDSANYERENDGLLWKGWNR